jgi:hypothetical protein
MYPKMPGLITTGSDYTPITTPANDQWSSLETTVPQTLDRYKKRVEIHMNNRPVFGSI